MGHIVTEVYEAFRAAGVDETTARAVAGAIPPAHDMATRTDIERLREEMGEFKAATRTDIERVRGEMGEFKAATRTDIERVRGEIGEFKAATRTDIERVRGEMGEFKAATRTDIERVRGEIGEFKAEIYRALWLQGVGIVTLTVALLRILP